MKTLRLIPLFLAALSLSGCGLFNPTYAWHQKMTVEVETPDGIKTGSSVTSVKWVYDRVWKVWNHYLKGEAVVVDLGGGKILFVLLASPYLPLDRGRATSMNIIAPAAFSKQKKSLRRIYRRNAALNKELLFEVAGKRGRASSVIEIPEHLYPLLVTFDSIDTPASVKKVEPYDLKKHFGESVKLKRITLEVTKEPVTRGKVGKLLTWLGEYPEPSLGPPPASGSISISDTPFYRFVHFGDFRKK